jgi:hypothetical protein
MYTRVFFVLGVEVEFCRFKDLFFSIEMIFGTNNMYALHLLKNYLKVYQQNLDYTKFIPPPPPPLCWCVDGWG